MDGYHPRFSVVEGISAVVALALLLFLLLFTAPLTAQTATGESPALGTQTQEKPSTTGENAQNNLGQLRKQIEDLKREYQGKLDALEKRLNDVEQENREIAARSAPAAEQARESEETREQARQTLSAAQRLASAAKEPAERAEKRSQEVQSAVSQLGSTPLYDQIQSIQNRLSQKPFEFHGYLRSGFGTNDRGGQQVAFQVPGADAKYRLAARGGKGLSCVGEQSVV